MNFSTGHYIPELTPLYGSREFESLSLDKRHKFFFEYIKLVAEGLVLFEQLLAFGIWHFRKNAKFLDEEVLASLSQFALEEHYHSQGFRHFLYVHDVFDWKNNKIYADSSRLKKLFAFVIKKAPTCVFLPGAKLEAFSVCYYKMIKKYYTAEEMNSWVHLNYIHQIDEAFHIPLEFDLHNSVISNAGPVKTIIGSISFILLLQIALIQGSYKVISNVFPEYSFPKRIFWMIKMARWSVRTSSAYKEARQIVRQQFNSKNPKWGKVLSFIYW